MRITLPVQRFENLDKTFAASLRRLPKLLILPAQKLMHYSDSKGFEADAVVQLSDGRYALIEIKTERYNNKNKNKNELIVFESFSLRSLTFLLDINIPTLITTVCFFILLFLYKQAIIVHTCICIKND